MAFLVNPIIDLLIFLYRLLGGNFGLAIIALTLIVRTALLPLSIPSLRSAKKLQALKPHLDALKRKHQDKLQLQQAQLELYKQHGVNPLGGCLPQIAQIIVLIALYQAFIGFINQGQIDGTPLNMSFFWLNLSQPDKLFILPVLAGISQLVYALALRPGLEGHVSSPKNKAKKQKEEDSLEMAQTIQQQMTFLMPAMTVVIATRFPSGLALYWVITTVYSFVQQLIFSGPGGLTAYLKNPTLLFKKS